MRNRLEIGDDFRLIPSGTEVYNGGNTIIKVLEDTIIAKIFYKEQAASEEKKELAYSLAGKINIIVDTILVTKKGAVGKSIDKVVSTAAMKATDFVDFESLDKAPEQLIDEKLAQITGVIPDIMTSTSCHDVKIDFGDWHDRRNTCILYAPAEEKHGYFILVVSKKKIVVVDEPHVYVVGKKRICLSN